MGETSWPCPVCGQAQKESHANGQAPSRLLCAACKEDADAAKQDEATYAGKIAAKRFKEAGH